MNELKENFEGGDFNEKQKETIKPLEKIEEVVPVQKKEELLENIYKKEEGKKEDNILEKDVNQEKTISGLIKEYFSVGAEKTVKKAKKLGAYVLDMFHDELTKKNRSEKK